MTFGAVLAAILAVVAAADDARAADPREDDVAEAGDETTASEEAAPVEALPGPAVDAPEGPALADSGPILLERTERANGWAVERLLEPSGAIVEHEVDRAGTVRSCQTVGSLFTLRVIEQRPAHGGEVVEVVRDRTGALLSLTVAADGEPRAVALLAPPPP